MMIRTKCPRGIDPRKHGLKQGLRQLSSEQIQRVLDYKGQMCFDRRVGGLGNGNYVNGCFCPLSVGLGFSERQWPNSNNEETIDEHINASLRCLGFNVNNTREIAGYFYTTHRERDHKAAAEEVLKEREGKILIPIVAITYKGRVLMLQHDQSKFEHEWCVPGGKMIDGESPVACAARELKEETGIFSNKVRFVQEFDGKARQDHRFSLFAAELSYCPDVVIEANKFEGYGWFNSLQCIFLGAMAPFDRDNAVGMCRLLRLEYK